MNIEICIEYILRDHPKLAAWKQSYPRPWTVSGDSSGVPFVSKWYADATGIPQPYPEVLAAVEPYALLWEQEQRIYESEKVKWPADPELVRLVKCILESIAATATVEVVETKTHEKEAAAIAEKMIPVAAALTALPAVEDAIADATTAALARIAAEAPPIEEPIEEPLEP